ncbi:hypothetical protein GCM10011531_21080 [Aquaticitalea lipolytica]|jgi:hypothetical protein|uniref:DUF5689 domain-containing protein n=1 Tax=Aquaticitalea lipolytica TaxID=1247562 RepID=A0A8J2TTL2_9FLAO|nr:DUF5689 domain-containing protein [Aquaticitalea lipolytica]GFZ89342.1 hypothetical protein GCM10011531_21080 [Aquaticitalea lipolytica]|tara:strand:- start:482 stop:1813 length:1332 start_codon:yes stop_codon:yes gene_type:complete
MKNIILKIMKTNRILSLMSILFLGLIVVSCVQDDDYNIPTLEIVEPNITANTTISIVKSMYAGTLVDFTEASNGGELIIEGYVVSNDEAGNFYKVLVLQDAPENPTAAIQLDIDVTALYSKYKPGRKVYVKLNGLGMTNLNGVLHIGSIEGNSVGRISATNYEDYIIRSSEITTLVPKLITPSQYNDNMINMLVQLDNMQLSGSEVGQPYANADDTFTVNRKLKNCDDNSETILRNSGFASFKNELFPTGKGSIVAIFSKYNSDYQLFIRDTEDVDFEGNRCDPLFEDSFSDGTLNKWDPYSVTGAQVWYYNTFGNPADSATMSGFSSGNQTNEDWLISKPIDMTGVTSATLTFQTVKRYAGNDIQVFMSTNYTGGNPNTNGTWTQLTAALDTNINSWSSWTNSGDVDVSAAAGGTLFIAFKYTSTTSASSTWEVDNVEVISN